MPQSISTTSENRTDLDSHYNEHRKSSSNNFIETMEDIHADSRDMNDNIRSLHAEDVLYKETNEDRLSTDEKLDLEKQRTNLSLLYVDPEQRPPVFKTRFQEYICVFVCIFAPAAASMASSAYQTLLKATSEYFHIQGGQLTWCVSSVMLANGACLLLMGGIADAFGRKNAIIIGFTMYAVFSLIAGFMHNFILLCLFRGLQGAAVACATPAAAGFLGATYKDSKRKNMVMSCFGIGAPVGGAAGFFVAGVCEVALDWRAVQFFLTIVFGILTMMVVIFIPSDKKINWAHSKAVFRSLDYFGAFLSLSSFVLICFSLTNVDATEKRWRTPYIIALLIVGVFLIGVFVLYELYIPKNPLMPMQLFKNKDFCLCMAITSCGWMIFFGMLNYNAMLYFENIRNFPVMIVACCFLPLSIAGIMVNIFAGLTMHIIPGQILMSIGCLGFTGAAIVWATISKNRNYFLGPFWGFILSVVGADLIYNVSNRVTLSSLERKLQSRGAGTFNTIIQLSSAVALGLNSTIIMSKYEKYGAPDQNSDLPAFLHAMRYSYYFAIALGGTAFCLSLFLRVGVIGKKKD